MVRSKRQDLRDQLLAAALRRSKGELDAEFSAEELLVEAWQADKQAWGLRGHENLYPDSDRITRELDSRGKGQQGLVGQGLLARVEPRVYRLTAKGMAAATKVEGGRDESYAKLSRALETQVRRILEHPVFVSWLKDPSTPTRFRDAGHFWEIAPGTPARVIRDRILTIEETLQAAEDLLDDHDADYFSDPRGAVLYEKEDINRALEFQDTLRRRFADDLKMLGVDPSVFES